MRNRLVVWMTVLLCAGCTASAQRRARRSGQKAAERMRVVGWFWVNPSAPPLESDEAEDAEAQRRQYEERFAPVVLQPGTPPCDAIIERTDAAAGPVYLLVHGIGGDNEEMEGTVSILAGGGPVTLFMYRWLPYDEHTYLAKQLAEGINRIAQCLGDSPRPMFVLAHSAGGLLASYAMEHVHLKARPNGEPRLQVLTVASPLAGTGRNTRGIEFDEHVGPRFLLDLGGEIRRYPRVPPHVQVLHLRTHESADKVMVPSSEGHRPNDLKVGVVGARQVDLPHSLGHDQALLYTAKALVSGEWRAWRKAGVLVPAKPELEELP